MQPRPLTRRRAAAIAAARAAVGTCFRPQGRVPGLGLDCVGLVLVAARAARVPLPPLPGYALGGDHDDASAQLVALGCRQRRRLAAARPGDVLLVAPAGAQRHLLLLTDRGAIHAHAGLGRVVEGPLAMDWAMLGAFVLPGLR
jgi:cell wall-associated NlpC family hydrolase